MQGRNWIHISLILAVCCFSFFVNNGAVYLDIMESRNLVTAHEMVEYDNWLVPTMNGQLRLEKPPLPTWIAAGLDLISTDNIPLQRSAAGVMATLLVLFLYFFSSRLTGNRLFGLLSALVLATSFNVIMAGRVATWDIYCHSFMLGAIFFFYRAVNAIQVRWWDFILAGILLGFSFLGKGPVSFYALLLPFLICYLAIYRPSLRHKILPLLLMVLVFVLVSFWWPLYLYIFTHDTAVEVLAKESTAWIQRNVRPWYYYWQFFAESGIWSLFLLTGLCWPWLRHKVSLRKEYKFAVAWTFLSLILLSLFPEKKTRYLLPLLVPASMVVGHYMLYIFTAVKTNALTVADKIVLRVNAFLPAVIGLGMPVALYILFYLNEQIGLIYYVIASLLFLAATYSIFEGGVRLKPLKVFAGVVILLVLVETLLMNQVASMFNNTEIKSIRQTRRMENLKGLPFYHPSDEELRIEIVYEAGHRILSWDVQNDTTILDRLPVVLVSAKPAEEVLPGHVKEKVTLHPVDVYDNNPRKKNTRRYSPQFIRYVTILEPKTNKGLE